MSDRNKAALFLITAYEDIWRRVIWKFDSDGFDFKSVRLSGIQTELYSVYPDGSYTPYTWLLDCWTPAGMLSVNLTDSVHISGDLWEEWHVAPTN